MFDFIPAALNFIGGMEQRDSQEQMFSQGMDFNSAQAAMNRDFSSSEAATNRDWQERMSNSAYQRARADMEKAGFNPMLAYSHGGASTPAGAQGAGSAAQAPAAPHLENLASGAISSGLQAQTVAANVEKTRADARLANAQAANEEASPSDNLEDADGNLKLPSYKVGKILAETELSREQKNLVEPTIRKILNEAYQSATGSQRNIAESRKLVEERLNVIQQRGLINAETRNAIADAVLRELEQPRARNLANVQSSPWMVKVSPYLRDLFTAGASAAAVRSATR